MAVTNTSLEPIGLKRQNIQNSLVLEPYDGKLSRTVLSGGEGRKPLALPGPGIKEKRK